MQSFRQYRAMGQYLENRLSQYSENERKGSDDWSMDNESTLCAQLKQLGVRKVIDDKNNHLFAVDFADEHDAFNPKTWSIARKWNTTGIVGCTGLLVGWSSAIDSTIVPQAKEAFHVSEITENLATALYLIAFGVGSLISGPLSETLGRNPIYLGSLAIFMIWVMASGLAPNIGAQLVFRLFAGFFGCTPLTTFGGSTHDMWSSLHRSFVFPVMACLSFLGPFLAPMVGAFIGQSTVVSWRWTEWSTLIMAGLITGAIFLFAQETYPPILLDWKAKHLRRLMNDDRYVSVSSLKREPFLTKMRRNIVRPFELFFTQSIVMLWCFYLSLVYVILFTFLPGYNYIFADTYDFDQGTTGLMYIGLDVGFLIALAICPFIYRRFKAKERILDGNVPPEERLVYAMIAAPCLPVSLFWMGWTAKPDISFWSPLLASVMFGFAMQGIFISAYLYLIDAFGVYAASALVSLTLTRYICAGGMVMAANAMYEGIGVDWTLTLLGCLGVLCAPIPFGFYAYGARVRAKSI